MTQSDPPPPPRDVVLVEVFLTPHQFARLSEWVTRPTASTIHGDDGGMQNRRRDWLSRLNETRHSILLTTHSSSIRKTKDDISWITSQIIHRHKGGFQDNMFHIFADTHPSFTGLPILPRPERKRRAKP